LTETNSPAAGIWTDYQKALLAPAGNAVNVLKRAIQQSLGTRKPSGLIVDADNRLGVTTTALLESGYEVLSLAPPQAPQTTEDMTARFAGYGERVRVLACPFGTLPDGLSAAPDGIVAFTDILSTLLSEEALEDALRTYYEALSPGGSILLAHADYDHLYASDPDRALSDPVVTGTADDPTVILERREWTGAPRSRRFASSYHRLSPSAPAEWLETERLAASMADVSEILRKAGFEADRWKSPEETSFHQPLVLATKPPVPMVFNPPSPLDLPAAPALPPTPGSEAIKFQFFPEDLDVNPFEERPDERKSIPKAAGISGQNRKQVTLVMLSGGIDSVYVLQRLLRESDDEIIAHHIHFVNREGRHKAEAMACKRIVAHFRQAYRTFHYTESTIDRRRFESFGMDDMCTGFEVGIVSNSFQLTRGHPIDRWTSGTCLEEELEYYGGTEIERFEHVLNAAAASSYPSPAPRCFQLKIIPKREQLDYMGNKVVDLCWTCRTPVWGEDGTPSECGTCKTCTLMAKIRAGEETITHKPAKLP